MSWISEWFDCAFSAQTWGLSGAAPLVLLQFICDNAAANGLMFRKVVQTRPRNVLAALQKCLRSYPQFTWLVWFWLSQSAVLQTQINISKYLLWLMPRSWMQQHGSVFSLYTQNSLRQCNVSVTRFVGAIELVVIDGQRHQANLCSEVGWKTLGSLPDMPRPDIDYCCCDTVVQSPEFWDIGFIIYIILILLQFLQVNFKYDSKILI